MQRSSRRTLTTCAGRRLSLTGLGFGAAQVGNMGRWLTEDEANATIEAAWACGMRYFDTAPLYGLGLSERRVGRVLRAKPRDSFVISSKVGLLVQRERTVEDDGAGEAAYGDNRLYAYDYDSIMRSVEMSLERLGLSHIDILYVHDIDSETHGSVQAAESHMADLLGGGGWRALDELRSSGAVCAIGAGLNNWRVAERLLEVVDPDVFLLAGRYTLLEQTSAESFLPACEARGVGVVVGGAFNSGILATGPTPNARYDYVRAPEWAMERTRRLQQVCDRYGVPLAQAALQFPLGHPAVVSVVAGSYTADEVERNAASAAAPTPHDLWAELKAEGLLRPEIPTPA